MGELRMRNPARDAEEGSILLLTLGYVLLALAVVLVCVCATDLYLAQKRLDALADSAAAAAADGFTLVTDTNGVRAELDDQDMRDQAQGIIDAIEGEAALVDAWTPDGVSVRVTVTVPWHPPVFSPVVPDGVVLEATATSRTALQ
jgi:hypothetical protein